MSTLNPNRNNGIVTAAPERNFQQVLEAFPATRLVVVEAVAEGAVESATAAQIDATSALTILNDKLSTDGSNAVLPTADPAIAGALWSNTLTVKTSVGP